MRPPTFQKYKALFAVAGLSVALSPHLFAANVALTPAADTTLIQLVPTNNIGAQTHFSAGTTFNGDFNRGLLRFDLAGQIPAGSKIKSVLLTLVVVGQPIDMPADSTFQLHRLYRDWGEGHRISTGGLGRGSPATTNEATWNDRFAFTTNTWAVPGAASGVDFAALSSSEQFVYGPNFYDFFTTARLVSDVQTWLDYPGTNFGWLLKTENETVTTTARRFGSREDVFNTPVLSIEYLPPPLLQNAQTSGPQVSFTFLAEGGQAYTVQATSTLSTNSLWTTLTNIPAPPETTHLPVADVISAGARFYRVITP